MTDASADYAASGPRRLLTGGAEGFGGSITDGTGYNPFLHGRFETTLGSLVPNDLVEGELGEYKNAPEGFEENLAEALDNIESMLHARHKKYGAGNIAKHGELGIRVRMDDKLARLEAGLEDHNDETVENTLDDIIGYAVIWKLWRRGQWPGSPKAE